MTDLEKDPVGFTVFWLHQTWSPKELNADVTKITLTSTGVSFQFRDPALKGRTFEVRVIENRKNDKNSQSN